MSKKIWLILIIFLLLVGVSFELYFILNLDNNSSINTSENKNVETKKRNISFDIYSGYKRNAIDKVEKKYKNVVYYEISGLKDKEIENKINEMISSRAKSIIDEVPTRDYIWHANYIDGSFENALSVVFTNNEVYDTLNFDLRTGNQIEFSEVIGDKVKFKVKLTNAVLEELTRLIGFVCGGGPCENPNPDYSSVEDNALIIINKFLDDDFKFSFNESNITLYFENLHIYNPLFDPINLEYGNSNFEDIIKKNIQEHYDENFTVTLQLIDFLDDLYIYDIFKTKDNIFEKEMLEEKNKFISSEYYYRMQKTDITETDDTLIDYFSRKNYYGFNEDLEKKLKDNVIKESSSFKNNKKFNIFNIIQDCINNIDISYDSKTRIHNSYNYFGFDVYHYSLDKNVFNKNRQNIYVNSYLRVSQNEDEFNVDIGYEDFNEYKDRQGYFYYIFDSSGNEVHTKDIFDRNYDFSQIIPLDWIDTSIDEMLNNAYIFFSDVAKNYPNHLVFQFDYYDLILRYKNKTVKVENSGGYYDNLMTQIFK